ncbi:MAG: RagB/SusD family nutrient uptake outer membrane protein, partial [Flavobacteriales bacterium]
KEKMKITGCCKWVLLSFLLFVSCDSFLDIEPKGRVIPKTLEDFRLLIDGAYADYKEVSYKSLLAFRTDELKPNYTGYASVFDDRYKDIYLWNDAAPGPKTKEFPYRAFYNNIFTVNHIINKGRKTIKTDSEKEQLMGEAYALRAYAYFDLINLYGKPYRAETAASDTGVPLVLDLDLEGKFKPQLVQRIYDQVLADMAEAKKRLNTTVPETGFNYRFSVLALYALEARVNLYMERWESTLQAADKALSLKSTLVNLNEEVSVLPNAYDSPESILALENTFEVKTSLHNVSHVSYELLNLYDMENDSRFSLYFPRQGVVAKGGAPNKCSFRVAELYLIQSEALLHLDRLADAKKALLTLIRNRYQTEGLPEREKRIESMDKAAFTAELSDERQRELALEGHRWFDLRRTTQPQITHVYKGKTYTLQQNDPRYTLPFPKEARLRNPFLTHPEPGS